MTPYETSSLYLADGAGCGVNGCLRTSRQPTPSADARVQRVGSPVRVEKGQIQND